MTNEQMTNEQTFGTFGSFGIFGTFGSSGIFGTFDSFVVRPSSFVFGQQGFDFGVAGAANYLSATREPAG